MARLTIDQFTSFFVWYKDLPHQRLAIAELWKRMPVSLLEEDADWIQTWRDPAIEEDPKVSVCISGGESDNSWGGVLAAAKKAGAKYPEVVAAQWALESAWGEHTSGENNYFGIKATGSEPYSTCTTWEHYDGKDVTIQDKFRDFDSLQECVDDLVIKWYQDYRGYKGVNRALTVAECAALLVVEGYATDPQYAAKLMRIISSRFPS